MFGEKVLSGSLGFVGLADVFQILGGNGSSGVLKIRSRYAPHTGIIYFQNGEPINAVYDSLKGVQAIYSLFGWTEGDYFFDETDVFHMDHLIRQSRMEIVLDALRMLDDGEIKKIGPLSLDKTNDGKRSRSTIKGPLLDYMHVVKESLYKDGDTIVEEGKHGKWIWAVYQGTVKITRKTDKGPLTIARLGEGCFIGTFRALLFGEYERNATVTAEGDVLLGLLDSEPFYHEYASLSQDFRSILLSLDDRLRKLNDKAVELSVNEEYNITPLKNMRPYMNGTILQEDLFTITQGNACIVRPTPEGNLPLFSLNKNDVFGDIPFLNLGNELRSASILVSDDFRAERIDVQNLQEEYDKLSPTFRSVIYNVGMYITMTANLVSRSCNRN